MRRIIYTLLLLYLSLSAFAQKDSIPTQPTVQISIIALSNLQSEKDVAVRVRDSLMVKSTKYKNLNKILSDSLSLRNIELRTIKDDYAKLNRRLLANDTCLADIASNFLYIPYEAYSVEQIAIPAFEHVQELSPNRKIKLGLLKSYQQDIKEVVSLLNTIHDELMKPFADAIVSQKLMNEIKKSNCYVQYKLYSDYKSTFLGKKLEEIIQRLSNFDKTKKDDCNDIKAILDNCLKTIDDL